MLSMICVVSSRDLFWRFIVVSFCGHTMHGVTSLLLMRAQSIGLVHQCTYPHRIHSRHYAYLHWKQKGLFKWDTCGCAYMCMCIEICIRGSSIYTYINHVHTCTTESIALGQLELHTARQALSREVITSSHSSAYHSINGYQPH